jgi:hypothetical protein
MTASLKLDAILSMCIVIIFIRARVVYTSYQIGT